MSALRLTSPAIVIDARSAGPAGARLGVAKRPIVPYSTSATGHDLPAVTLAPRNDFPPQRDGDLRAAVLGKLQ
jgi:hypothetical protein